MVFSDGYNVSLKWQLHWPVGVSPDIIHYTGAMLSYTLFLSHYLQPMSTTPTLQPLDQVVELPSRPQEKEASQAWKSGRTLGITLLGKTYWTSQADYINTSLPRRAACLAKWRHVSLTLCSSLSRNLTLDLSKSVYFILGNPLPYLLWLIWFL